MKDQGDTEKIKKMSRTTESTRDIEAAKGQLAKDKTSPQPFVTPLSKQDMTKFNKELQSNVMMRQMYCEMIVLREANRQLARAATTQINNTAELYNRIRNVLNFVETIMPKKSKSGIILTPP